MCGEGGGGWGGSGVFGVRGGGPTFHSLYMYLFRAMFRTYREKIFYKGKNTRFYDYNID